MKVLKFLLLFLTAPFLLTGCKTSENLNEKPNFNLIVTPSYVRNEARKGAFKLPKNDVAADKLITALYKDNLNKTAALKSAVAVIKKHNAKPKPKE